MSFGMVSSQMSTVQRRAFETGRTMVSQGHQMTLVGAGIAAIGAAALAFFFSATKAAMEYNRQSALTLTQVSRVGNVFGIQADASKAATVAALESGNAIRGYGAALERIKDIGRDVAREIPVPFEEVQTALFDIFSSMDVGFNEAEELITSFSKAAVAGQTDLQTASRATIAVLNGFAGSRYPIQSATQALDIQFQMVRRGVGTYAEFSKVIGRAIPQFAAAGQRFETLAGSLSFLTRAGLSAAMSATSVSRAMEVMARPDSVRNLEAMGVVVRDKVTGEFRQLNEIITDLAVNQGWKDLTGPQLAARFKDTFGTSTIMARRFFFLAIQNADELNSHIKSMRDSAGSLETAFREMATQPAMRMELLKNQFKILREEIGEALIPVIVFLMAKVSALARWFSDLSPSIKTTATYVGVIIAALTTFIGIATMAAGVVRMLAGAMMMLGVSAPAAAAGIKLAAVAMGLLPVALFLIISHFDKIMAVAAPVARFLAAMWDTPIGKAVAMVAAIFAITAAIRGLIALRATRNWISEMGPSLIGGLTAAERKVGILQTALGGLQAMWGRIVTAIRAVGDALKYAFVTNPAVAALAIIAGALVYLHFKNEQARKSLAGTADEFEKIKAHSPTAAINYLAERYDYLRAKADQHRQAIEEGKAAYEKSGQPIEAYGGFVAEAARKLEQNTEAQKLNREEYKKAVDDLKAHREAIINSVPPEARQNMREYSDQLADSGMNLGEATVKLEEFAKQAEETAKETKDAFSKLGSAFELIEEPSQRTAVNYRNALKETLAETRNFYLNLKKIADSGKLDMVTLNELATAGPKEAGKLASSMVQDLEKNGGKIVDEINTLKAAFPGLGEEAGAAFSILEGYQNKVFPTFITNSGKMIQAVQGISGNLSIMAKVGGDLKTIDWDPSTQSALDLARSMGYVGKEAKDVAAYLAGIATQSLKFTDDQLKTLEEALNGNKKAASEVKGWLQNIDLSSFNMTAEQARLLKAALDGDKEAAAKLLGELRKVNEAKLNGAREEFIVLATAMGLPRDRAEALIMSLKTIDRTPQEHIKFTMGQVADILFKDRKSADLFREGLKNVDGSSPAKLKASLLALIGTLGGDKTAAAELLSQLLKLNGSSEWTNTITTKYVYKGKIKGPSADEAIYQHGGGLVMHEGGVAEMVKALQSMNKPSALGAQIGRKLLPDEIPAVLQRGEYVFDKMAVNKIGVDNLRRLHLGVRRMHEGGAATPVATISRRDSPWDARRPDRSDSPDRPIRVQVYLDGKLFKDYIDNEGKYEKRSRT